MTRRIAVTIALVAALLPLGANASVSLELSLSPAHIVAGLPVSFSVKLANTGASAYAIPTSGMLVVKPLGREPFLALAHGALKQNITLWLLGVTTVKPHGAYSFDIPVDATLDNPAWFTDPRLDQPGTYQLQLVLTDTRLQDLRNVEAGTLSSLLSPGSAVSNTITLTVDTPQGDDAAVWKLIIAAAPNGRANLCRHALSRPILSTYPNSSYAQYVVLCAPFDLDASLAALERALATNPSGPVADWQQFMLADLSSQKYREGWARDLAASVLTPHAQKAVAGYRTVVKIGHSTLIRNVAQQKLDELLGILDEDGTPAH